MATAMLLIPQAAIDPNAAYAVEPAAVAAAQGYVMDPSYWAMQAKGQPAVASRLGGSRALPIKNPKTGELIAGSPEQKQPESADVDPQALRKKLRADRMRQALLLGGMPASEKLSAAAAKGGLAAAVLAKRSGTRWRADSSIFTALNIEGASFTSCRQAPFNLNGYSSSTPCDQSAGHEEDGSTTTGITSDDATQKESTEGDLVPAAAKVVDDEEAANGEDSVTPKSKRDKKQNKGNSDSESSMARDLFLRFRELELTGEVPSELKSLLVSEPTQKEMQAMQQQTPAPPAPAPQQQQRNGRPRPRAVTAHAADDTPSTTWSTPSSQGRARRAKTDSFREAVMTPGHNAYRVQRTMSFRSRHEELKRTIQSQLNKICPENVVTIGEQLAEIEVNDMEELRLFISLIFKKALSEPHYCETYADLVFNLKSVYPEFPSPEGGKAVTFKSTLLNICQEEFEALPSTMDPTESEKEECDKDELEHRRKKKKDRLLANMKFIGHLFLRQLLSARVIGSVLLELVLCGHDELPHEHVVECACELLLCIGYALEAMPTGAASLASVCGRLMDLKGMKDESGKGVYSKRMTFAIQDLLDTRASGWTKKTFKSSAKTKEEIRLDQKRDQVAQARGKETNGAEHIVAGQRPQYMRAASGPLK
eukprot:TRINITY_DN11323_c0_g1_i1.p1 TRINITY_DN11323_c0_g1~~TRINITY_DN11323_c0_g1_i1.p1  ORF type:complete len:651 (-),score=199.28 TRINITY_DN11323_c0_g1_i1:218-2170(-)